MTEAEVIQLINDELPTNGNNAITAAILRPVLIAMVQQINNLVGNPSQLPENKTVIEALNEIEPTGVEVHVGENDPNDVPPGDFNVGDFYQQVIAGNTVAFWQFVGEEWINLYSIKE